MLNAALWVLSVIGLWALLHMAVKAIEYGMRKAQNWLTTHRDRVPDTEILAAAIHDLVGRVDALEDEQDTEAIETISEAVLDMRKAVGSLANRLKRLERDMERLDELSAEEEPDPLDMAEPEHGSVSL